MASTFAFIIPLLLVLLAATALFGADSTVLALILSGLLLGLGSVAVWMKPNPRLAPAQWLGLWGGAVVVLGQMLGPAPGEVVPDLTVLLAAGAVYFVMVGAAANAKATETALKLMAGALILIGLVSFLDYVTSPGTLYGQAKAYHEGRLTAAFLSANTAATMFGMFSLFGLAGTLRAMGPGEAGPLLSLFDRVGKAATMPLLVLIFSATCLLLTGSRGGLAATLVAGTALVLWERRGTDKPVQMWTPVLVIIVIGAALMAASSSVLGDRLAGSGVDAGGRALTWAVSWQAFLDAPLFGHGFGRFEAAIAPHITLETAPVLSQQGAAHNLLLQWLVQAGFIGTAGGLAVLIAALLPLYRGLRRRRRQRVVMKATAATALLVLLHGMLDYALEIPALVWWFAAFLGLGAGVAVAEKTESSSSHGGTARRAGDGGKQSVPPSITCG